MICEHPAAHLLDAAIRRSQTTGRVDINVVDAAAIAALIERLQMQVDAAVRAA